MPVPAAVQHHVRRYRTVLLPDVRVAVSPAPGAARRHQGAGTQGRASAVDVLGVVGGHGRRRRQAGRPAGHTGVQRGRHTRPADRAPRVHGTVRSHQSPVPGAAVAVHVRQRVPHRRLHVWHRVRRDHRHVGEEEARQLRQHGHLVGLLRHPDHPALVLIPVRTLRDQKGIYLSGHCTLVFKPYPSTPLRGPYMVYTRISGLYYNKGVRLKRGFD